MPTKITFIFIDIEQSEFIFNEANGTILIRVIDTENKIQYREYTKVNYDVNEYLKKKEYYIYTNYYDIYTPPPELTTFNFVIKFNQTNKIFYEYNAINRIIYFYKSSNKISFNMLGLKNFDGNLSVISNLKLSNIDNSIDNLTKIISLKNESLFDENYLELPGTYVLITELKIYDITNLFYEYYLYQTILPLPVGTKLKIYFYDSTFIRIINIPYFNFNRRSIDSVTFLVELLDSTSNVVYKYLTNPNFDYVDNYKSTEFVLFFKNYVTGIEYSNINIRVFESDFSIYFLNLTAGDYILCNQITLSDANLYNLLVYSNNNIPTIPILNLDENKYFKGIELEALIDMISFNNDSKDLITIFLSSEDEQFDIFTNYLYQFKIKSYNFYNILFSYNYEVKPIIEYTEAQNISQRSVLYPENVLINNILINIEIVFKDLNGELKNYNIYGTMINNNNTWDIYTKSYNLNNTNKYNLLKDINLMAINYEKINIYLYNDIGDLNNNIKPSVSIFSDIYYKYNNFLLNRENSTLGYTLDANYYLKFYINIKSNYNMLIFYSNTLIDSEYDILNFKLNNITRIYFKLLKVKEYTGNVKPGTVIFNILFQTIQQVNDFLVYLKTGQYVPQIQNVSSYFNIPKSVNFKKQADGYYIPTTELTDVINFSVLDLDLNNGFTHSSNSVNYE